LKAFYPAYLSVMWVTLACLFVVFAPYLALVRRRAALSIGAVAGYVAGLIAYTVGPAMMDGSFARITSTIGVYGLARYIEVSLFYPVLILSPVAGVVTAAVFAALSRSAIADRYLAAAIGGGMFVGGWTFFLTRGVLPFHW
jgi:hypothetical protein